MKYLLLLILHFVGAIIACGQSIEKQLDDYLLATAHQRNAFNGTALVVKTGKVLLHKGYGFKDVDKKTINDTSSIYQAGSLTKAFTAAVMLQLEEQQLLRLNDTVTKFLPGFHTDRPINIEQLLRHTSGIPDYLQLKTYTRQTFSKPIALDTLVSMVNNAPLLFTPGSKFSYSNSGYFVLAAIIKKVTGKIVEQIIREKILGPSNMQHAGFDFTHLADSNKAINYINIRKKHRASVPVFDSTHAPGCGNLYATTTDLYRWLTAFHHHKIISAESLQRVYMPGLSNYGYGWFISKSYGRLTAFHGGGTPGFRSHIQDFIDENTCIILLSNNENCDLSEISSKLAAIMFETPFERLVYD